MNTLIDPASLTSLRNALGTAAAMATLPGTAELVLLTAGALRPLRTRAAATSRGARDRSSPDAPRLAVVVPAHDEEDGIARTVRNLADRAAEVGSCAVVVIADNCIDRTGAVARGAGARVLERDDPERRGKGHALAWAFDRLLREPFDAFVVVDADSVLEPGTLRAMADRLALGVDAVQVPYGVSNPSAGIRARLMRVALLAFNRLRPRGRAGLRLSCGILGNGFALSRATLESVPYTASSIVEDVEYHLRLVRAGRTVEYVAGGQVLADMPVGGRAATQQRTRWEGGRLRMLAEHGPALLRDVAAGRLRLVEPLLDLALAPLALHVLLLALALCSSASAVEVYALAALAVVVVHVVAGVVQGGASARDVGALALAPLYIAWKIAVLPATLRQARRDSRWVRTTREPAGESCS
jgi:cellulose synthase/poly-beta-1,6-N-acetylglucosamine synthase-like glycosyltransferase